ncbi:hypothetical protein RCO27_04505 [Sphingosinicella sp. LHD-64]|uniref:hypothetical protein n=1 Tax=Sphingosinicella sp. LHD-64 TaxID=3072139 RepID=UPI00280D6B60|nr:hypothetical protein [Sphingosinicella sp. LHD-64]MDQ8755483.1 hypothetical protein [Sphingosinicella sp. LHD-64]
MRKVLVSIALATATIGSTAIVASPAVAQPAWRLHPGANRQIQQDINQLDRRITRAEQRRTISRREAFGLRREANDIRRLYARYSRNGLDRREVRDLQSRVNTVHARLRYERRDWDRWRG